MSTCLILMTECLFQADMKWDDPWMGSCVGGGRPAPACSQPSGPQPRSADAPLSPQVVGTGAGMQEEAGRVIRQPVQINKKNIYIFFFTIYYFCIHIYIYNSRTQTYIHLVQVHPGDSPTPHHPSPRWVWTLHFPLRGKGCQGASTDPGRSL